MFGPKILVLLSPLLFMDGAHSDSDAFRRPQPGKPWVAPTLMMNSTEDINKQKQFDLDRYVSQLYETSDPENSYTEPPASDPQRDGNGLYGYRCPQPDGYFKYTDRCDEYVKCKNSIPITYTCPIGLHFNPIMQWTDFPCDHPSRVQCDEPEDKNLRFPVTSSTTTTTTTTPPPPTTPKAEVPPPRPDFMCPQPHGYFRYTDECSEYVECKNYVPLTFQCPLGLHFNPRVEWTQYPCDIPSKVQCNEKPKLRYPSVPKPTTTTTTTTTPPPTTPAPKIVTTPRPGNQIDDFRCPQPHGYFKYTDECEEYIECKNYIPLTYTCPGGLHFNPNVRWTEYPCDYPSRVQCNRYPEIPPSYKTPPPPTTTTTTTPPPPPPTTEPAVIAPRPKTPQINYICPQRYGYFKHSNQCGEYVECKNYVPLMFTCPVGLHFNPVVQWTEYPCEHPSKVQCDEELPPPTSTTTTTTTTTPAPTPAPKVVTTPRPGRKIEGFKCPQPQGYFEYAGQCSEYVECKNEVPLTYSCPAGLHFNSRVPWTEYPCDHPLKAQCNSGRK